MEAALISGLIKFHKQFTAWISTRLMLIHWDRQTKSSLWKSKCFSVCLIKFAIYIDQPFLLFVELICAGHNIFPRIFVIQMKFSSLCKQYIETRQSHCNSTSVATSLNMKMYFIKKWYLTLGFIEPKHVYCLIYVISSIFYFYIEWLLVNIWM